MNLARTSRFVAAGLVGVLVAGPVAFWYGARVGVQEFALADAKFKASVLTFQLERLQRQDAATVESLMQIDLNDQLANHGRYLHSNWNWLFPEMKSLNDREIRYAVKFRVEHPYNGPDLSLASGWKAGVSMADPFVQGAIQGQRENNALLQMVIAKYAQ